MLIFANVGLTESKFVMFSTVPLQRSNVID